MITDVSFSLLPQVACKLINSLSTY